MSRFFAFGTNLLGGAALVTSDDPEQGREKYSLLLGREKRRITPRAADDPIKTTEETSESIADTEEETTP